MKETIVVINILGRGSFTAPLIRETTSGYEVRMGKTKDSTPDAIEWFPKFSPMTRSGILQQE